MKFQDNYERALKMTDKRYARIFEKMGYSTRAMRAAPEPVPVVVEEEDSEEEVEQVAVANRVEEEEQVAEEAATNTATEEPKRRGRARRAAE